MSADEREATALQRVKEAVTEQSVEKLSNVFYGSYMDGEPRLDDDGETFIGEYDYGFDCDDLAVVLLPLLTEVLNLAEKRKLEATDG